MLKSKINIFPTATLTKDAKGSNMTEFGLLKNKGIVGFTDGLSSVQGTVIDINGEGLEGVLIEAEDKKTYTNAQGKYWLYDLDGEEARIIFELDGYVYEAKHNHPVKTW